MHHDPFTLRIALDRQGQARGNLYLDDGETYKHRDGELVWRAFAAERDGRLLKLTSQDLVSDRLSQTVDGVVLPRYDPTNPFAKDIQNVRVERIFVLGLSSPPKSVEMDGGEELRWDYSSGLGHAEGKEGEGGVLIIKDPKAAVIKDWSILVRF
jgi:mannosyl-oligosaccharide alpha-1,3-glucosidase